MGYTGTNHWTESDCAADAFEDFTTSILKSFVRRRKEGRNCDNEYNTTWYMDIALIIEAVLLPSAEQFAGKDELLDFLKDTLKAFDYDNRTAEKKAINRLKKVVETFIKRAEEM